jgi:hypothetical protein
MNDNNKVDFLELIANVYAFYRQDFSRFAGGVWYEAMKPFDFPAVADALNRHCINPDSGQFMPKPADIVKMLKGSTMDSALVAWSKVDKAIRQVGTYESVVFDDPLIHRVLADMGGWQKVGMADENGWPFLAKEFENRYRGYSMRNAKPEYPPVMVGIAQSQNEQQGFRVKSPRLLGDKDNASAVYLGGREDTAERILLSDILENGIAKQIGF